MAEDPYKILESLYSQRLLDNVGAEFIKVSPSHGLIEMTFTKVFWGQVGLSGFTLYPNIINYCNHREIINLSKRILNYYYNRIDKGYSIEQEFPMCMLSFAVIGCRLDKLGIEKNTLSCVPKFLFRSLTKFSIHNAQVSIAKDYDENNYQNLHFVIISCFALLVYAYKRNGLTNFIKESVIELANSYIRNITIFQFMIYNLSTCIKITNTDNIYELLKYKGEALIKKITDNSIYNDFVRLLSSELNEMIESVEKYELGYIYKLEEYANLSYTSLVEKIKNNYFRFICPSYIYLLDQSGKYYDEMIHLNVKFKKWNSCNDFDHVMIYMLAGWLQNYRQYACIENVSQERLASDITNYILNYIRHNTKH